MSIQAIAWVLEHSRARGLARLVLISLANHFNAGTGQCNPGQRRLAHEAGIAVGTVRLAIDRLVQLGQLEITVPGHGGQTAEYHFPWLSTDIPEVVSPAARPRVMSRGSRAEVARPRAARSRAVQGRAEPSLEPKNRDDTLREDDQDALFMRGAGWIGPAPRAADPVADSETAKAELAAMRAVLHPPVEGGPDG